MRFFPKVCSSLEPSAECAVMRPPDVCTESASNANKTLLLVMDISALFSESDYLDELAN